MRRAFQPFADNALDFFQFIHQMKLRWQATGGINHHHIHTTRAARLNGIECDSGRIARGLRNHRDVIALTPHGELLTRGRTKGITRRKQYFLVMLLHVLGEFAYGGRFTRAIHTRDHDHQRLLAPQHERFFQRLKQINHQRAQCRFDLQRVGKFVCLDFLFECVEQELRRLNAGVCH